MSQKDQEKWDQKYAAGAFESRSYPSQYLKEQLPNITQTLMSVEASTPWRALDIACGAGRNAHYLALNGFTVDALDISRVGLDRAENNTPAGAAKICWTQVDLDHGLPNDSKKYDLIIMFRYVNASLLAAIGQRLSEHGHLLCEEHLVTNQSVNGPSSERFRVATSELETALVGYNVIDKFEGIIEDPDGSRAAVARILVRNG